MTDNPAPAHSTDLTATAVTATAVTATALTATALTATAVTTTALPDITARSENPTPTDTTARSENLAPRDATALSQPPDALGVPAAPVTIVPMAVAHLEQVVAMENLLFAQDSPWTAQMFAGELADRHHYVVATGADGDVVGYAGVAIVGDDAEVRTIAVRADHRGRGIGRALLADLIAGAGGRRMVLEVRVDNDPAIALYTSAGFRRMGLRRKYYQPSGADAYTMARPPAAGQGTL